uniref:Uncharacterized protein n=1 Tax=viral metagenome TaxID=1070528 RepID=A0A6C0F8N3_9ZZZZ
MKNYTKGMSPFSLVFFACVMCFLIGELAKFCPESTIETCETISGLLGCGICAFTMYRLTNMK